MIESLDADVIGLQEIDDREALEQVFSPTEWIILIDDDSGDDQDVAVVIARDCGLEVVGFDADLDADEENFLFPDSSDNNAFPNRRDALAVELRSAGGSESLFIIVQHTKARYGGRLSTAPRRAENSRMLLLKLEERFQDEEFIVVGDFNDSPDDQALNIIEDGNPNARTVMENEPGAFLINLVEPLWARGMCSWGHNSRSIGESGDTIDLVDPQARAANFHERNSNDNNFHKRNLLDHILIPHSLDGRLAPGSVAIFDGPAGVRNGSRDRASDHLPVYAEFFFAAPQSEVRIVAALPDPDGRDAGNETVTLQSDTTVSVDGWSLADLAGHRYELTGTVTNERVIRLPVGKVRLNQNGDTISLFDSAGTIKDHVAYTAEEVSKGEPVTFD